MLVLNATYDPINVCTVRRATVLLLKDKAEVVLKRAEEIALREQRMLPLIRKHKSVGEAVKAYNWI